MQRLTLTFDDCNLGARNSVESGVLQHFVNLTLNSLCSNSYRAKDDNKHFNQSTNQSINCIFNVWVTINWVTGHNPPPDQNPPFSGEAG